MPQVCAKEGLPGRGEEARNQPLPARRLCCMRRGEDVEHRNEMMLSDIAACQEHAGRYHGAYLAAAFLNCSCVAASCCDGFFRLKRIRMNFKVVQHLPQRLFFRVIADKPMFAPQPLHSLLCRNSGTITAIPCDHPPCVSLSVCPFI